MYKRPQIALRPFYLQRDRERRPRRSLRSPPTCHPPCRGRVPVPREAKRLPYNRHPPAFHTVGTPVPGCPDTAGAVSLHPLSHCRKTHVIASPNGAWQSHPIFRNPAEIATTSLRTGLAMTPLFKQSGKSEFDAKRHAPAVRAFLHDRSFFQRIILREDGVPQQIDHIRIGHISIPVNIAALIQRVILRKHRIPQ